MANENEKKKWPRIRNKKAFHNYEIVNKFEAGISLKGSEVKSLRMGNAELNGSYARIIRNECYLIGCKIEQYKQASYNNHVTDRSRKLLLHSKEISKLIVKVEQKGYSLIPLALYFNERGLVKVELGLAKGKKLFDKRDTLKKKDQARDLQRSLKNW